MFPLPWCNNPAPDSPLSPPPSVKRYRYEAGGVAGYVPVALHAGKDEGCRRKDDADAASGKYHHPETRARRGVSSIPYPAWLGVMVVANILDCRNEGLEMRRSRGHANDATRAVGLDIVSY